MVLKMVSLIKVLLPGGASVIFSVVYNLFIICALISVTLSVLHIVTEIKGLFKLS